MVPFVLWQCCTCGATISTDHAPAPDEQRECVQCHLYGRPAFPRWRWRVVDAGTPAEQRQLVRFGNALVQGIRARYGRA